MMKHLLFTLCDWVSARYEHIHKKSDLMSLTRHLPIPFLSYPVFLLLANGFWIETDLLASDLGIAIVYRNE